MVRGDHWWCRVWSGRTTCSADHLRHDRSRGKSKRTKRSDGDQGVITTTAYQIPQFTDNEVVRMMCSVNLYLLRMKAFDYKIDLPNSYKGNI